MTKIKIISIICLFVSGFVACEKLAPGRPPADEILDGPVDGLSYEENRRFLAGDFAFNKEIFTTQTGLGSHIGSHELRQLPCR